MNLLGNGFLTTQAFFSVISFAIAIFFFIKYEEAKKLHKKARNINKQLYYSMVFLITGIVFLFIYILQLNLKFGL